MSCLVELLPILPCNENASKICPFQTLQVRSHVTTNKIKQGPVTDEPVWPGVNTKHNLKGFLNGNIRCSNDSKAVVAASQIQQVQLKQNCRRAAANQLACFIEIS